MSHDKEIQYVVARALTYLDMIEEIQSKSHIEISNEFALEIVKHILENEREEC